MEVIFAIITHISVNTVKVRTSRSYVHFSTYNHSVCFFISQLERKRNFYSFPPRTVTVLVQRPLATSSSRKKRRNTVTISLRPWHLIKK